MIMQFNNGECIESLKKLLSLETLGKTPYYYIVNNLLSELQLSKNRKYPNKYDKKNQFKQYIDNIWK